MKKYTRLSILKCIIDGGMRESRDKYFRGSDNNAFARPSSQPRPGMCMCVMCVCVCVEMGNSQFANHLAVERNINSQPGIKLQRHWLSTDLPARPTICNRR